MNDTKMYACFSSYEASSCPRHVANVLLKLGYFEACRLEALIIYVFEFGNVFALKEDQVLGIRGENAIYNSTQTGFVR